MSQIAKNLDELRRLRTALINAPNEGEATCIRSEMKKIKEHQKRLVDEKEAEMNIHNATIADNLSMQLPAEPPGDIQRTGGSGLKLVQTPEPPPIAHPVQPIGHLLVQSDAPVHEPT